MFSRAALPYALVAALSAITSVQAHGYVYQLDIGNVSWSGYLPYTDPYEDPVPERIVRKIPGNGPVENVSISE
ncbi:hypothetical protein FISHEDRAFT_78342 [Fistulina hepatica ATCC 64428]|nr:hypothetical protein FISHEDRAFT_78342 [Fistulina hepatica ATCC 64428]